MSDDATEVLLPQWGMGMQEGTIVEWLKAPGDTVALDEPLVEVDTAKATEVMESPIAGTLASIVAQEGDEVPVRAVICTIIPS